MRHVYQFKLCNIINPWNTSSHEVFISLKLMYGSLFPPKSAEKEGLSFVRLRIVIPCPLCSLNIEVCLGSYIEYLEFFGTKTPSTYSLLNNMFLFLGM